MEKNVINCGIYRIVNTLNNKIYIGSSSNLKLREFRHFRNLSKNRHDNKYLQEDYNNEKLRGYFKFEIIEEVVECEDIKELRDNLYERENYWINYYKSKNSEHTYNIYSAIRSVLGIKHTYKQNKEKSGRMKGHEVKEDTKIKISESKKGEKNYMYGRIPWNKGITPSEETKKKISLSHRGKKLSKEHVDKIQQSRKGYAHSEETKEKIRLSKNKEVINLTTGELFNSTNEAAKAYNVCPDAIGNACRGLSKTSAKCKWKFKGEYNN